MELKEVLRFADAGVLAKKAKFPKSRQREVFWRDIAKIGL